MPSPFQAKSTTKHPKFIGWPDGRLPVAPPEFTVSLYTDKFESQRWLYLLPNGEVLVAETCTLLKKEATPEMKEELKKSRTVTGTSAKR